MEYEKLRELGRRVRLVISDMDGTLLDQDKKLSARTREAVRALKERGILFTICTGRIPTMIEYYVRELDIGILLAAANGALVWDPVGKKPVFDKPIPGDEAVALMDFCRKYELDYSALTLKTCFFSKNSVRLKRFEQYNEIAARGGGEKIDLRFFGEDHGELKDQKIYKMLIYELKPGQSAIAESYLKEQKQIAYTTSDDGLWDVSAAGVSKGAGLEQIAGLLSLKREEICAFGDFYNDVSMLEFSGLPIAMENGCDTIKKKSIFVAKPNDQDGVADAIEKILL